MTKDKKRYFLFSYKAESSFGYFCYISKNGFPSITDIEATAKEREVIFKILIISNIFEFKSEQDFNSFNNLPKK